MADDVGYTSTSDCLYNSASQLRLSLVEEVHLMYRAIWGSCKEKPFSDVPGQTRDWLRKVEGRQE